MARAKSGRKPGWSNPPDEWAAIRAARRLVATRGADPALASHVMGILLARGVIDQDEYRAGELYRKDYAVSIGRQRELGVEHGENVVAIPGDDEATAAIQQRVVACARALNRLGRHVKQITDAVAVYGEMRPWLIPDGKTTAGNDDRHWLKLGLDALVKELIGRRERRAA